VYGSDSEEEGEDVAEKEALTGEEGVKERDEDDENEEDEEEEQEIDGVAMVIRPGAKPMKKTLGSIIEAVQGVVGRRVAGYDLDDPFIDDEVGRLLYEMFSERALRI